MLSDFEELPEDKKTKLVMNMLHAAEVGCLDMACQLNEEERVEVVKLVVELRTDIKIQTEYGGLT